MYFDSRMEPPEPPQPTCPVCGERCDIIIKNINREVIGCDKCLTVQDAWEYLEETDECDEEPSDYDLEIGFDPYLGCYTEDC